MVIYSHKGLLDLTNYIEPFVIDFNYRKAQHKLMKRIGSMHISIIADVRFKLEV